jgi:GT2 family glycosyltransferase
MQYKKHYFIIVNYNSGENIIECIQSILHSKKIKPYIIIVDNASRDNSLENCKINFPNLTYIYNTHNIGFAAGANIGARFALERNALTITFCNPDAILDPDCAFELTKIILSGKADLISPIIYKYNSSIPWFEGGKISFYKHRAIHKKQKLIKDKKLLSSEYISGCVMTIAPKVFEDIGLFDERFFLYYEDADLSLRAQQKNFTLAIVPTAKAWHKEISEQENPQKTYFLVYSGLLFFQKHSQGLQKTWFNIRLNLRKIKNASDIKKGKPLAQQVHKAYSDYDTKK